eukprot:5523735-Pleurochrysis_carterae.AAC.1
MPVLFGKKNPRRLQQAGNAPRGPRTKCIHRPDFQDPEVRAESSTLVLNPVQQASMSAPARPNPLPAFYQGKSQMGQGIAVNGYRNGYRPV